MRRIEYDGSPRRIGQGAPFEDDLNQTHATSNQAMHLARPGFPQVVSTVGDSFLNFF